MSSPEAPSSPDSSDADTNRPKIELSDLDAPGPPRPLPVEQDLMQLARLGELRAIQKLFDSGAYHARSTDEQGITALHWAAINGHHALCHFLLQSGADVNAKGGDADATPVLWASKRCNLKVVSLLLARGADPLLRDDQGYNVLHSATLDGNVFQLVLLLHHSDIGVDVLDAQGHTSLMWAAYMGFGACVDLLLRWGADVHAVDKMGFTALHWALVKGNYLCIQKLIEYGSDRFVRSHPVEDQGEGDSPAETAVKMKSQRQWHRALLDSGFDELGMPLAFPVPFVKDRRTFFNRFFFLWPFFLGGLQLHMLAFMLLWIAVPGVLLVGYALQFTVQKLLRWAPSDMKHMHRTPFLAGIFAATLFWVGVRYVFHILPLTLWDHFILNLAFMACYGLSAYFYFLTMTSDPGYVPKGTSRGQTKATIEELVEHDAFNEHQFCTQCMIRKPLRSSHCRRCGRCVAKEDHHCPWVHNCVAVNNHRQFLLYVWFTILGIAFLIRLTFVYIEALPPPSNFHCAVLNDELCEEWSKDPLTLVTNTWAALQLTWTSMLIVVHLTQIARAVTTYESIRGHTQVGPLAAIVAAGSLTPEGTWIDSPQPADASRRQNKGCLSQWSTLLGFDAFFAIAFRGSRGRRRAQPLAAPPKNHFSRGILRNCQDFWMDGPVFGRKHDSGRALLGGETVDYTSLYDLPGSGMGYRRRGGYEGLPGVEEDVL